MQAPLGHMPLAVSLAEIGAGGAAAVGAKAATLARLCRAGMPVPPGFCLTRRAYREHVEAGGVLERVREALARLPDGPAEGRRQVLAEIRRAIAEAPLAAAVREEVERRWRELGGGAAAVRSSALAEDLPDQSFAGQYDTYLGVADLPTCLGRVKDCWASLWTDRAFEYRRQHRIGHLDADMAVIVQALVPAEVAGVMFTADPVSGRRDCAVIEASLGLGEAVVTGKVTPDRLVVSTRIFRVERRTSAAKAVEVVPAASGGVREQPVDAARAAAPCLDDATAGHLALLGANIAALLGGPQDVEWALASGRLHVLQARPITALPPPPRRDWADRQIWANTNLREVAPGVMTPMTGTLIRRTGGALMLGPLLAPLGVRLEPEDVADLVAGRLYFNVNTGVALLAAMRLPWRPDPNIVFGGGGAGAPFDPRFPPEDLPPLAIPWHRRLTCVPVSLWGALRCPMRRGRGILSRFRACVEADAHEPWRDLADADLARRIETAHRLPGEEFMAGGKTLVMAVAGIGCALLLMHLCRRWLGDEHADAAKRLLGGLGGMDDAEAGIALWLLAATAHRHPAVEAAVREEKDFAAVARRLAGAPGGEEFLAAWSAFMAAHGHHADGELELSNPRWAELPDFILGLVRSHLAGLGRLDPVERARRLARERRRLERHCAARLRNPLKRMVFDAVLRRAQEAMRFRQTAKSEAVRWIAHLRQMLLELGERLARRGVLERRDDVFFLQMDELGRAVAGDPALRPAVAERLAEHRRNLALDPPPIVFGRFVPDESPAEVVDARAGTLRGIGVSPGVARGPARIILHPGDGHLMPGEVLVAPVTDPSWTPYFVGAAAIVMDQGGQLSHGSILAREYGIPCVTNVGPATRILATGQAIEVDGSRGVVRMIGRGL